MVSLGPVLDFTNRAFHFIGGCAMYLIIYLDTFKEHLEEPEVKPLAGELFYSSYYCPFLFSWILGAHFVRRCLLIVSFPLVFS